MQMAKQGKNKDPQEFADRCRVLAQKVMGRDSDPIAQRTHRENAQRMCLASFVGGLQGTVGRHTRIANPQSMQQSLTIALAATEAVQEKGSDFFFTKTQDENSELAHDMRTRARQN